MISFLSQLFFELVECVRFNANWSSAALFDHAEDTCEFIDFVLANVHMLLDTVDRTSLEIGCWI